MSPVRVFIRKDAPSTFLSLVLSYDCRCLWILLCRRCRDTNTPCPQISWKSFKKNVGMAYEVPQINSSMIRKVRCSEGGNCYIVWMISNADRLAQMRNWLVWSVCKRAVLLPSCQLLICFHQSQPHFGNLMQHGSLSGSLPFDPPGDAHRTASRSRARNTYGTHHRDLSDDFGFTNSNWITSLPLRAHSKGGSRTISRTWKSSSFDFAGIAILRQPCQVGLSQQKFGQGEVQTCPQQVSHNRNPSTETTPKTHKNKGSAQASVALVASLVPLLPCELPQVRRQIMKSWMQIASCKVS